VEVRKLKEQLASRFAQSFALFLVLSLFFIVEPVFGLTIGVPDELLTGLPSPELSSFGETLSKLFTGYTGVEPNIVEGASDELMRRLIQGDVDAILSRPQTGIESAAYVEGSPLAKVSTPLPGEGDYVCLPATSENLRIIRSLQLGLSATSGCEETLNVELTLVPVYAKTEQGILFQNKFEEFLTRSAYAVSLAAKSAGFTPVKPTAAQLFWNSPWSWFLLFLSVLVLFILGTMVFKLRKENRSYKEQNHLQLETLSKVQSQLLNLQHQAKTLTENNNLLTQQKQQWEQAQKSLEIYLSTFKELLRQLEVLGRIGKTDSLSTEFIEQMCVRMKTLFSAKEVALYLYSPRNYKYTLAGGHIEGIEPTLAMTDPLVYSSSQSIDVVEKDLPDGKTLIGTLGTHETANGIVIVKDPAVPNPNQLLSAVCNTLYLVISLQKTSSRVANMEQLLSQLEKLERTETREDFIKALNDAGVSVIDDLSPDQNFNNFAGRLIRLDNINVTLVVPENWPSEVDFILEHLASEILSNRAK